MEEISIPEIPYELTCYNLDCEVPLAFPLEYSETSKKLEELPSGLVFPDNLKDKIRYDANKKLLIFKRVMSKEIKDRLLTLSADGSYKKAVEALFYLSSHYGIVITIENIEKCSDFFAEGWKRTHLIKRHLHLLKLVSIVHPGNFYDEDEIETSEFINEERARFKGELARTADFLLLTLRLLKSSRIWMRHIYDFIYSDFLSTNIPLKPYKLKDEDTELIHKLYLMTGYFLEAVRVYLKGEQGKIQSVFGMIRGHFGLSGITEIQHNIDLALSYYMRAHDEPFYRKDISLIQLFIALETLFVQKGDEQSIKYKLCNRAATLLGEDPNEQKHIQEILKKLYELRGDIIHGSEMPNPDITHDLLQKLFEYVRLSILYFIGLARREKKDIINILDSTLKRDDKIRELRKEIRGYYPPELHKVLQFNAE